MALSMSFYSLGSDKMCWSCGASIMVAAFLVTTWSLQSISQMEHKDSTCNIQAQNGNLL
jgi:hypothetical protein